MGSDRNMVTAVELLVELGRKLALRPDIADVVATALEPGGAMWDLEWATAGIRNAKVDDFAEVTGLTRDELTILMRALTIADSKRTGTSV